MQYDKLINKFIDSDLDVIAITDHNTIEGIKQVAQYRGYNLETTKENLLDKIRLAFSKLIVKDLAKDGEVKVIEFSDETLEKVDTLMIGGAMAYTFFKAMGYEVGNSICELDKLDLAQELMEKAKAKGVKLMLPVDTKVGKEFDPNFHEAMLIDKDVYNEVTEKFIAEIKDKNIDYIISPEARGFLFGCPVASKLNIGFIPVRKKGKLPCETVSVKYDLEYIDNWSLGLDIKILFMTVYTVLFSRGAV